MGIYGSRSRSSSGGGYSYQPTRVEYRTEYVKVKDPTNPDPNNFKIRQIEYSARKTYALIKITYPNCTNFKGQKILLVKCNGKNLLELDTIDPHFLEEKGNLEILARFRPTQEGWALGMANLRTVEP